MDELVKRLRCSKYGSCPACPMWYSEEVEPNLWRERCAAIDAADAIEELLQKTQQMPRWIPVTERLPEEYVNVLCHLRSLDRQSEYYSIDHLMEDGQWWKAANSWKHEVTHWMPLPEPPKEEATDDKS